MRISTHLLRLVSLLTVGALCAPAASADVVTEWNALALDAIRVENNSPTLAARNLAILHIAIYDAVNSVERTHQPYFLNVVATGGTVPDAAAVGAAHQVMVSLYPTQRSRYDTALAKFTAGTSAGARREESVAFGRSVANAILEWRSSDGISTTVPYIPSSAPGRWRRTPPFFRPPDSPQCPFVVPFAVVEGTQFRPPPPPPLHSRRYAAEFQEVMILGAADSTVRTADQTEIARFWSDFSYTATPPGHWNEIAAIIADARRNTLHQNARLFALLNIAMADAGIVCWDAKYHYDFWRPVTAIRMADIDGNPDTLQDLAWDSLLAAPPFPEYTSGHSTFSKAASVVIANFFESDAISFTVGCDALPGVFRSFASLSEAADECGMSRIYGGIHFRSANVHGKAAGASLANYVTANFLLPVTSLPKLNTVVTLSRSLRLQLHGVLGERYVIEESPDLQNWIPVSTNTAVRGGALATVPDWLANPNRFFRAVPQR